MPTKQLLLRTQRNLILKYVFYLNVKVNIQAYKNNDKYKYIYMYVRVFVNT